MFGGAKSKTFLHHVQGTHGAFVTPAGQVEYILTKARLGKDATDPERRLTSHLAPVREVMQSEDLDFNQLLQRDLDDHRVATNLIPYLLRELRTGPAFFPPIVAVLLPFEGPRPSLFPTIDKAVQVPDSDLTWLQQDAGEAFRSRRLADADGSLHRIPLGQLWWNHEHARLVVLDGQHRAMALLAIERTQQRSWQGSGGERYRYFYEGRVRELLKSGDVNLDRVEVPVAVTWFPEHAGPDTRPHEAARKLFVDVNKEARQPSESRLILLSDAELLNVLTRSVLTALRNDRSGEFLPLYAVEYDNPEVNTTRSARWSVLTNIHLLKQAVSRLVFGPPKYLRDVTVRIGSREAAAERDAFMRQQLDLKSILPSVVEDGGYTYKRDEIGNAQFPPGSRDKIVDAFLKTWGQSILVLLSALEPYAAHARALNALKDAWLPDEAVSSLAYDALFSGVGMYWTLKDSAESFRREEAAAVGKTKPPKPDVVKAWEQIVAKQDSFETHRALEYLGSSKDTSVTRANDSYAVLNTHACQLGLCLALGTMWLETVSGHGMDGLPAFSRALASGANAWLAQEAGKARDHRLVFARTVNNPFNLITNMDTPRAVQFRYFWLQIAASQEVRDALAAWTVDWTRFDEVLGKARAEYVKYCAEVQAAALKTTRPDLGDAERAAAGLAAARKAIAKGLQQWFGYSAADAADAVAQAQQELPDDAPDGPASDDGDDVQGGGEQASEADDLGGGEATLEELLSDGTAAADQEE